MTMTTKPISELTEAEAALLIARKEWPDAHNHQWCSWSNAVCSAFGEDDDEGIKWTAIDWQTMGPIWERDVMSFLFAKEKRHRSSGMDTFEAMDHAAFECFESSKSPRGIANAYLELRYPDGVPIDELTATD